MPVLSLHWFRSKQRALARFVLAAFCLTWLQLAAMPCLMAAGMGSVGAADAMPEGMVMAPGEHCVYCPPEASPGTATLTADLCAFPHDPQVDSRVAFASSLLAPPPVVLLFVPHDREQVAVDVGQADATPPPRQTPLAVSFCRFLK